MEPISLFEIFEEALFTSRSYKFISSVDFERGGDKLSIILSDLTLSLEKRDCSPKRKCMVRSGRAYNAVVRTELVNSREEAVLKSVCD